MGSIQGPRSTCLRFQEKCRSSTEKKDAKSADRLGYSGDLQFRPLDFSLAAEWCATRHTMIPHGGVLMTHSITPTSVWKDVLLLVVGSGLLFGVALGTRDLWNPNEAIYGRAVVEMRESGTWLVPTVNGKVFAEKPILYYWGALAASNALGGVDEWSLRIPSAVAGVLSVVMMYFLALPYVGRKQALLATFLLATQYQVFWASRSVQMDILVLASTLGMLLPLSRMLDHGLAPGKAWPVVGVAAGVGLLAKGPVTLIVPGITYLAWCAIRRANPRVFEKGFLLGSVLAMLTASVWYGLLAFEHRLDVLHEVLIRQNFSRFVDAWDHQQPWWYYLKYFWIELAPWSWLVPLAVALRPRDSHERSFHQLGWMWIVFIVFFFSLSDSKRAPYILPIAPAVAILASGVLERFMTGVLARSRRWVLYAVIGLVGTIFVLGAVFLFNKVPAEYPDLVPAASILATVLFLAGLAILFSLMADGRERGSIPVMAAALSLVYLTVSVFALPAIDERKSARSFSRYLNQTLAERQATVASYRFWDWRAGYLYYSQRMIPNFKSSDQLLDYWQEAERPMILVEEPDVEEVKRLLQGEALVHRQHIGSRTAYLFARWVDGEKLAPG